MSRLLADHAPALLGPAAFLGTVVSVQDPLNLSRIQIRVMALDGVEDQDSPVWARVSVPFAGNNRGAFFIPDVGDEVLVTYIAGDPRFPIVLGGLWNGHDSPPETLGGDRVDRWTITGKAGTRIAIVEEAGGSATIKFSTPGGLTGIMTDEAGGSIEFTNSAQTSVKIDASGVTIDAPTGTVGITAASSVDITAAQVNVDAAVATFSGIVQCQVMQATTVVASTYTPGAGNVW
jgi:uncharacterized protein involved in type VI secretion and phage assembly